MIFDFRDVLSPLPNSAQWTDKLLFTIKLTKKLFKIHIFYKKYVLERRVLPPKRNICILEALI